MSFLTGTPQRSTRRCGVYRAAMRHGASKVARGLRRLLVIIFHDAS